MKPPCKIFCTIKDDLICFADLSILEVWHGGSRAE